MRAFGLGRVLRFSLLPLFAGSFMAALPVCANAAVTPEFAARIATKGVQAPFDANAVVDRIRFALKSVPGEDAKWVAEGRGYRAQFDRSGVDYTIMRPQQNVREYRPSGIPVEEVGHVRIAVAPQDTSHRQTGPAAKARVAMAVKGNEITYSLPGGVKEAYRAGRTGLVRTVTLTSAPTSAASNTTGATGRPYVVAARLTTDLQVRPSADGGVELATAKIAAPVMRYRRLTMQDANGKRLEVAPTVKGKSTADSYDIGVGAPARWLEEARYPVTTSLVIGDEIAVSTDATPAAGYDVQDKPAVASDGTNFLVVWQDGRNYTTALASGGYDIYGARVTPDGEVLDPLGIPICTEPYNQVEPDVAFDGTSFLVVWMDGRQQWSICGARVGQNGEVLDPLGFCIVQPTQASFDENTFPAVAYGAGSYLVAWQTSQQLGGGRELRAKRVAPTGAVLDSAPIVVMGGSQGWYYLHPACAFDGENFLVVAEASNAPANRVVCARVSSAGTPLDPDGIVLYEGWGTTPAVAFGASSYLVSWQEHGAYRAMAVRVAPSGEVMGGQFEACSGGYGIGIAFDGVNWLVIGSDSTDVLAARVNSDGTKLDEVRVGPGVNPAVGGNGSESLTAFRSGYAGSPLGSAPDIFVSRIAADGSVVDPNGFCVARTPSNQEYADVAFDGANYMVVWLDDRDIGTTGAWWAVYGARVSPAGTVLDPAGFRITSGRVSYDYGPPSIAFGDGQYLVAWAGWSAAGVGGPFAWAARVTPQAEVLGPEIMLPGANKYGFEHAKMAPDLAFGAGVFLAAYYEQWTTGSVTGADVQAVRITPAGELLDTAPVHLRDGQGGRDPAVAFDGANFMVAWWEIGSGTGPYGYATTIKGVRVSPQGAVLHPSPIDIGVLQDVDQAAPMVAGCGNGSIVVWQDDRDLETTANDIYGVRISQSGEVLDSGGGDPICIAQGDQWAPAVAFDGAKYLVVWSDGRSLADFDLFGARVLTTGQVLDADGLALSSAPGHQSLPALAVGGSQSLLVWDDDRDFPTTGRNVIGQFVDNTAPLPGVAPPRASFVPAPTVGLAPLKSWFMDTSAGDISAWLWRFDGATTSPEQSPSYKFSAGAHTVSLTVEGPGGRDTLIAPNCVNVTARPPVADFGWFYETSGPAPLYPNFYSNCQGSVTSLSWAFGDGATGSGYWGSYQYPDPGWYSPSLTATGPGGEDTLTKWSLVHVLGDTALYADAGPDKRVLPGRTVTLDGAAGGGTAPYTYSWSPTPGLSDPTAAQPTLTPTQTTTYTLTVTDNTGASDSDQTTVVIATPLSVEAGPDFAVSPGGQALLYSSVSGGVQPYTYAWSTPAGPAGGNYVYDYVNPTATTVYTLTITDGIGQTASDTATVYMTGIIKGQVRQAGTAINLPHATVAAYLGGQLRALGTTDSQGIYTIATDLLPGQYSVVAFKSGFATQTKTPVTVTSGQTSYSNFALPAIPALKGQVRAAGTTTNLAGATVAAYQGAGLSGAATADANGIYALSGLATGTYTVVASQPAYVRQSKWNIAVTDGATTYVNFSLAVSGKLRGQVLNKATGKPIIGATITARLGGAPRATGTTAAPYGVYDIASDLPAGSYTILCSMPGYQTFGRTGIVVTAGATTYVNFALQPQ